MTQADYQAGSGAGPGGGAVRGSAGDLRLLTADDVCGLLQVKKSWLYDTVEAGAIEVVRLGKQLRFQPSAVADYLDRRARSREREHGE